ncbi:hypothetical protein LSH36_87g04035 [Paralvinella palmiformis]|uniref:G-protein coupled receptors family 1 profile domain-containing protein n=1 Tax=Paralvinella palmiformis TaxID=53620 RepID=A0AAD9K298_9ANNE|nr:hypothetical protein LSH36_87g04035 [Paralvinella palmiformis]
MFHFSLAFLIIFANVTVSVALRFMKTAKKTTLVFLADLAISNLVQGIVFLIKAIFYIWGKNTTQGCILLVLISMASTGTYMTGIFFVYLDLYLSLKKMSVGKAIISARFAVQMVVLSWFVWIGIGTIAYGMLNKNYVYRQEIGCSFTNGAVTKEYILLVSLIFVVGITVIMMFHALTYRLIKQARTQDQQSEEPNSRRSVKITVVSTQGLATSQKMKVETRRSKWLKKNDAILKMIILVLIMFVVCWYPLVIITMVLAYCTPCSVYITKEVVYFLYILIVLQYNSNGIIYLIKIREFQNVCKNLCCKCCPWHRRVAAIDTEFSATTSCHE